MQNITVGWLAVVSTNQQPVAKFVVSRQGVLLSTDQYVGNVVGRKQTDGQINGLVTLCKRCQFVSVLLSLLSVSPLIMIVCQYDYS